MLASLAAGVLIAAAAPALAAETKPQKLFRDKLLKSPEVARSVKTTLTKGGFVDRAIVFADLTGEGKDDAIVTVNTGGSAGRIALYVFSAGSGTELNIAYRNQRLYRAAARVNPGPELVYSVPLYAAGDELCCASQYRETTLKWSAKRKKFGVAGRRTITP